MPDYEIVLSGKARRQMKKLDPNAEQQIRKAIDDLAANPRPQSSKRMKGNYKGYWRERTGDYRIIYEIKDKALVIIVIEVGHRKNIYH
jgi:mRNA interferase RelE/StbE